MVKLKKSHNSEIVVQNVEVAKTFWARGKGLLGRKGLLPEQGLWIHRCNSIHTFFMKFNIDCIFVDKFLKVKAVYSGVQPGRIILPVWGASSVFELAEGVIEKKQIQKGDQLHVDA